jgi:hypothetical protein
MTEAYAAAETSYNLNMPNTVNNVQHNITMKNRSLSQTFGASNILLLGQLNET